MKRLFLLISFIALSFAACDKAQEEPIEEKTQKIDSAKVVEMQRESEVVEDLERTPYMQFVKDIKIVGKKIAIILFCENYGEYQTLHPKDGISKEAYEEFWSDPERPKLALATIPIRLFKKHEDLETVDVSLSVPDAKFYLNINRTDFFQIFEEYDPNMPLEEFLEAHRDKADILFDEKVKITEK